MTAPLRSYSSDTEMLDQLEKYIREERAVPKKFTTKYPIFSSKKREPFMKQRDYAFNLRKQGFEMIGSGSNAQVFAKPGSDRVIKIGHFGDQWPDYIFHAFKRGYMGNFAPIVYSFRNHGEFWVAVMERLVCTLNEAPWTSDVFKMFKEVEYWRDDSFSFGYFDQFQDCPFHNFVKDLCMSNLYHDTHSHNYMLRKDGQIVCIDPAFGYNRQHFFTIKHGELTERERHDRA